MPERRGYAQRVARVLLVLALLVVAPAAHAAAPREAPALEPAASWAAGKPIKVICAPLVADSHENGSAVPRSSYITVDGQYLCPALLRRLAGRTADVGWLDDAMFALAHEAEHARGFADETAADCAALKVLPVMASRFFGYRLRSRELHDLMAVAWDSHNSGPPEYHARPC